MCKEIPTKTIISTNYLKYYLTNSPYKDKNLVSLLTRLKNSDIIDQDGIIILHRHKNEEIDLSNNYKIIEERKYGISKILFFSLVN